MSQSLDPFFNDMKKIAFTSLILIISVAASATSPDITGRYRCTGDDFLNHTTFDEPSTLKKTGDTYTFEWHNKNIVFNGTAIRLGETISAIFWSPTIPTATPGVVTYHILPNGDLKGKWTIKEGQVTGNEYCQKLAP